MTDLQPNLVRVEQHLREADEADVPALFNFPEQTWNTNPLLGNTISKQDYRNRVKWWEKVWSQIKAINPSQKVGVYCEVPMRNYWDPVLLHIYQRDPSQDNLNQWNQAKPRLTAWKLLNNALKALADCVDVICPSLYLHYEQYPNDHWSAYAKANIDEAKQYGKDVYAVVCPRYQTETWDVINVDRWKRFLADVAKCDPTGIILWDYYGMGSWESVKEHFAHGA